VFYLDGTTVVSPDVNTAINVRQLSAACGRTYGVCQLNHVKIWGYVGTSTVSAEFDSGYMVDASGGSNTPNVTYLDFGNAFEVPGVHFVIPEPKAANIYFSATNTNTIIKNIKIDGGNSSKWIAAFNVKLQV